MEPSLLLLGTCSPNSIYDGTAVFHVNLEDCSFTRMVGVGKLLVIYLNEFMKIDVTFCMFFKVTGGQLIFLNDLTHSYDPAFSQPVVCAYERWKI